MALRIVLINPAFYDGNEYKNRFDAYLDWIKGGNLYVAPFEPPLGLAYLSSALKAAGDDVTLLDMQGELMDSAELERRIRELQPDLVGITAMTPTLPEALRVAEIVRASVSSTKIVLGGVHPTLDPESVLANPAVDFVIRGEGEVALAELALAIETDGDLDWVDGLSRRENGAIHVRPKARPIADMDDLPLADYDAFPIERYIEHNAHLRNMRGISMLISRGCPYRCTFCAVHQTMGRKWRPRSPDRVVDQIIDLRDRFGIEGVWFKDSIFNINRQWVERFSEQMVSRKVNVTFQALTRVDLIREPELELLVRAGLTQLDLGIEAGSERILAKLHKGITPARIRTQVALAKKHVKVFGFFMIGIPGETEDDVLRTFELAKELELDRWTWSIYSPLPGSALYDELVRDGRVLPSNLQHTAIHFTEAYEGICEIPPGRLKELYREINDYFYQRRVAA
ncbi:MAG: B12-binding domain-containing radical SAM protein [Myxococcales bacterium]